MRWFLLLLVATLMLPRGAVAQTPTAHAHFPTAGSLGGDGWVIELVAGDPEDWPGTASIDVARYFGPRGARALIAIARVAPGPSGVKVG